MSFRISKPKFAGSFYLSFPDDPHLFKFHNPNRVKQEASGSLNQLFTDASVEHVREEQLPLLKEWSCAVE